jgi:hypothetical protein
MHVWFAALRALCGRPFVRGAQQSRYELGTDNAAVKSFMGGTALNDASRHQSQPMTLQGVCTRTPRTPHRDSPPAAAVACFCPLHSGGSVLVHITCSCARHALYPFPPSCRSSLTSTERPFFGGRGDATLRCASHSVL